MVIPVSINVFNFFPTKRRAFRNDDPTLSRRRVFHSSGLLVGSTVKLEIFFKDESKEETRVIHSSISVSGIHPCWELLDEKIERYGEGPFLARVSMNGEVVLDEISLGYDEMMVLPQRDLSDMDGTSWWSGPILKALPSNSIVVKFSDETMRVPPSLYFLLLEANIICEDKSSNDNLAVLNNQRRSRFSDTAFDVLEEVNIKEDMEQPSFSSTIEKGVSSLPIEASVGNTCISTEQIAENAPGTSSQTLRRSEKSVAIIVGKLKKELESELRCLETETVVVKRAALEKLEIMKSNIALKQVEIRSILEHTDLLSDEATRMLTYQYSLQVKCLRGLRDVYPITRESDTTYLIRGMRLPADLWAGIVAEEEVSAALGFLCHCLQILSKYLSNPLRFRLVCNSSRSAIQDNYGNTLPLFQSRIVEHGLLERGMRLLNLNLDCALNADGICSDWSVRHPLAKLQRLFDKYTEHELNF